jgi:nitrite reductase/ring-hydroxylating ferredoxin subunit
VPADAWIAVAPAAEIAGRHITFARVHDVELALWRDDSGVVNAWENRCPHRGVRLTIGTNTGEGLTCRYHGWRFASGSGTCTFIPAHPAQTPPKAAFIRPYANAERYGFVWVALAGDAPALPAFDDLPAVPDVVLRSVTVHAPDDVVRAALARECADAEPAARFFTQPESADVTTVHGAIVVAVEVAERLAVQRAYNERLTRVRDRLEGALAAAT